jgi:hypothetical protein
MAAILMGYIKNYIGTAAEMAALATTELTAGSTFQTHDTKVKYTWNGSAWLDIAVSLGSVTVDDVGLKAGDNNVGNVDIVTLPAGNLGQKTSAASLSTTPATDIADATYIGDIKFGEGLPAGSSLLGKVGIDQSTANANEVVTKTGSITTATLNAETTKVIGTVNDKVADGDNATLGAKADSAQTDSTQTASQMAFTKGIAALLSLIKGTDGIKKITDALPSGTNFIGRSGATCFKAICNFTRPADTSAYSIDDSIANVTAVAAVTFQDTGDTVTLNGHGLCNGTIVSFATIVTTTGISTSTNYFVVGAATNTFQVAATYGGGALPLTSDGTGTMNALTLCLDLSAFGATAGQYYQILNARVISSVKGSVTDLYANVWIFNSAFNGTFDNAALSIDDTTAQTGGVVVPCANAYRNAANHRCVSDCGAWTGKLGAADTKLYLALQAANAYTPTSGETFYVVFEGMLL